MGNGNAHQSSAELVWEALSTRENSCERVARLISRQMNESSSVIRRNAVALCVNEIKAIIKDKERTGSQKCKALLLLKKLMELRDPGLIKYVEKRLLRRLYLIASHKFGPLGISKRNYNVSDDDSKKFYALTLCCFDEWSCFGEKYSFYFENLCQMNRRFVPENASSQLVCSTNTQVSVPIREVVVSGSAATPEMMADDDPSQLDADKTHDFEDSTLKATVVARQKVIDAFSGDSTELAASEFDQLIAHYFEIVDRLKLRAKNDPSLQKKAEKEIVFHKELSCEAIKFPLQSEEKIKFLYRLKRACERVFSTKLNIDSRIKRILNKSIANDISMIMQQRLSLSTSRGNLSFPVFKADRTRETKRAIGSSNVKINFALSNPISPIASPANSRPRRSNLQNPSSPIVFPKLQSEKASPQIQFSKQTTLTERPTLEHKENVHAQSENTLVLEKKLLNDYSVTQRPRSNTFKSRNYQNDSSLTTTSSPKKSQKHFFRTKNDYSFRTRAGFESHSEFGILSASRGGVGNTEGLQFLNHLYRDINNNLNRKNANDLCRK